MLGIGRDQVFLVDVDRMFRLDMRHLESQVGRAIGRGLLPLAVVAQEAPYLMATPQAAAFARVHQPPASVGPFILEGSKPGAAAASCWLSHRLIPPNRGGYGEIMRASLLAARELYERLVHWDQSCRANREARRTRFIPVTIHAPDTNMICFLVQERACPSLDQMNRLAERLYR